MLHWLVRPFASGFQKAKRLEAPGLARRTRHRQPPLPISGKPLACWQPAGASALFHLQTEAKQNCEHSNVSRAQDFAEQTNAATDADDARGFSQSDATLCESESQASSNLRPGVLLG